MADKKQSILDNYRNDANAGVRIDYLDSNSLNNNLDATSPSRKENLSPCEDQENRPRAATYQKDLLNSNAGRQVKKAPLVGWQNDSPIAFPSSPINLTRAAARERSLEKLVFNDRDSGTSSTKSIDLGISEYNTDELSSLADEKLSSITPALTIDRSIESLSPDKETLGSSENSDKKDYLSAESEPDRNVELLSPIIDCKDDNAVPIFDENYLASPNLTIGPSHTNKNGTLAVEKPSNGGRPQGILLPARNSEKETRIISNPVYLSNVDSIDSSHSVLRLGNDLGSSLYEAERKKPKIPDGGWGWVVVMASLLISMVADGVSFSFGLLYIEFLKEFRASKSKTAWIGSLFMAVPLLSGPVMSALVDRYGCRNMTILGGLISGAGFVLSSFGNTIEVMYLTFGVLAGLGLGLCYVTAVVSIAYWFDKKRTLAVGLGACGTGIGTFVYAPMTTYFIEEYGWRGTTLLLAGTFFNLIVCGMVMRDPEWWVLEQQKQNLATPKKSIAGRSDGGRSTGSPTDEFPGVEELRKLLKSGQAPEYLLQSFSTSTEAPTRNENGTAFRSVVNLPTFVKQSEKVPLEVLESLSSNSRLYNVILENYPNVLMCRSLSDKNLHESSPDICNKSGVTMSMRLKQTTGKEKHENHNNDSALKKDITDTNPLLSKETAHVNTEKMKSTSKHHIPCLNGGVVRTDSLPWLRRQFNTNTHYFKDIRVHRNSVMYRGAALNLHKYRLRASSCPDIYRNSMTTLAKENEEKWYTELVDLLKGMMDFSMFLEFHFLLMSLSTILLFTWFIVPYFYLAEHLTRNGYTEADAAQALSIIGITNTIGMIGLGWAGDQPWMNVSKTYTWCLVACGIATILMSVFTNSYILLMLTSAAFGLFFASNFSFTPVILVELIPLERFTTAYGLSLLCQGIGNLLGPPLAGWFFDITDSWDLSFIMAGSWIIVSGFLIGLIPYTRNRKIWGSGPIEMERERECLA